MRAIVANLILGSIVSVTWLEVPVLADSLSQNQKALHNPTVWSAEALSYEGDFYLPPAFVFEEQQFDYFISSEDKAFIRTIVSEPISANDANISNRISDFVEKEVTNLRRNPLLKEETAEDLVLGSHNSFWHSDSRSAYWGLTTIKTWGGDTVEDLSLKQLDYLNAPPLLAPGASALTVSGGSSQGLKKQNIQLEEVGDFNGGVAFHQSLASEVTVGLGFVYEDFLLGFSQLTYQPENFPLRTTVSLLQTEDGLEFFSHLKLQPTEKMVFNLYGDEDEQKFDLNWGLASGLTLTADGNSETESLRAGAKLKIKNDWLSVLAQAQLDNNNEIQWRFNSRLGNLHLSYATDTVKTNTEIKYDFNNLEESDFQLAFFVNNKSRARKESEDNLTVWGWNVYSADKIAQNINRWEFNLGYGVGTEGEGAIASMGLGLSSNLSLKLSYEEISLVSDETRVKFQLSSH